MSDRFLLFGYGSLIFDPELPEALRRRFPAVLPGYRRAFNSVSRRRGFTAGRVHDPEDDWRSPLHHDDGHVASLALGLVPDASAEVHGFALEYPRELEEEVLRRADPREGYHPQWPTERNSYLRTRARIREAESERTLEATVYVSNPSPRCPTWIPESLPLRERARILIAATPREPTEGTDRARGLHYLEGVRRDLATIGIVDEHLEDLAREVRAIPGPWRAIVAPPVDTPAGRGYITKRSEEAERPLSGASRREESPDSQEQGGR